MRDSMTVDAELFGDALPTYFTRFIGRERECDELAGLLRSLVWSRSAVSGVLARRGSLSTSRGS
jgi:hypothetical protein